MIETQAGTEATMADGEGAVDRYEVVIVGSGHAGAQAAVALRQAKFAGRIAMIGDEPDPPYERPPLSKEYLSGDKPFERILIRPASFWAERRIDLLPGRRVVAVDAGAHVVATGGGERFGYGTLIWATGGAPRRLTCSGHDLRGVHSVRTRADVDRMMRELADVARVVVVGGGYIGLEAAAVLAKLGKAVTLVESLPRVLARVAGEPLSRFYEAEHRAHGVDIRLGTTVECLEGRDGGVCGVRIAGGEVLGCDMVVVGIGIVPSVDPLIAAGAAGGNGVDIDGWCRTSLPDVYAIGDCAAHRNDFAEGARIRLESVQNANDQAQVAAKTIAAAAAGQGGDAAMPDSYHAVPWFWSNQYDLRLQTVGLSTAHDDVVVRGDIGARSFSLIYLKGGRVIALDCVNATRDYVQGRALVLGGTIADRADLADSATPLKQLA